MSSHASFQGWRIAISISESPDLAKLGLSPTHLHDVSAEVARHLLTAGIRLLYGGDLRAHGFTELLFELVARYHQGVGGGEAAVTNLLAWPVHASLSHEEIEGRRQSLGEGGQLVCLTRNGAPMSPEERRHMESQRASDITAQDWAEGLTAMRRLMTERCAARVLLGGRVAGYQGSMPGIAEETLLALQGRKPVFLAGGFGGCARDITETMRLDRSRHGWEPRTWTSREHFAHYGVDDLRNGLSLKENARLASTSHADEIAVLVRRGLRRIRGR